MPDDDLTSRLAKLESRLPDIEMLKEGLSDVNVLKERCENIKEGLKKNDASVDTLKDDVSDLKTARAWLWAIAGGLALVFASLGVTGALVFKQLNRQITSLETRAAKLQTLFEKELNPLIEDAKAQLNLHADGLLAKLPPAIVMLEVSQQQRFIENLFASERIDPAIDKMTEKEGVDFDCSTIYKVPPRATGAIIYVQIFTRKKQDQEPEHYAAFLCADSKGKFFSPWTYPSFSSASHSYPTVPSGGLLFCPFLDTDNGGHSTKFRYRLYSSGVTAEKEVSCLGFIVGWY
jgi:hypothetical protein